MSERKAGVQLPESVRTFLTEIGNGGAGPAYGVYAIEEAFRLDSITMHDGRPLYAAPFPHTTTCVFSLPGRDNHVPHRDRHYLDAMQKHSA